MRASAISPTTIPTSMAKIHLPSRRFSRAIAGGGRRVDLQPGVRAWRAGRAQECAGLDRQQRGVHGQTSRAVNARPASTFAQASLHETLTVMMAEINPEASVTLPITTNRLDEASLLANPELSLALKSAIEALARAAEAYRTERDSA